ncbi:hypothetical protein [Streptomyces sp. NPDC060187]|uniref:hypothetical protein n=1 Tax=Streptomyces sp. NPDC060187 TaxID=3347067 RepID=UPI003652A110
MSTDIHGGIEFRHPGTGTDHYDGEPWVAAMDLWPLYDETSYTAFGCLFGVRNKAGFRPLAPGRGLPVDLSSGMRAQLGTGAEEDGLHGASWVSWAELAVIDLSEAAERVEWTSDERAHPYEPVTVGAVLGDETHWPHVFNVMKALAGRFGDDGVRLVVAFD